MPVHGLELGSEVVEFVVGKQAVGMELIAKNEQILGQGAVLHVAARSAFPEPPLLGPHFQKMQLQLVTPGFFVTQKLLQKRILFRLFIERVDLQAAPHDGCQGRFSQSDVAGDGDQFGMLSQVFFQLAFDVYGLEGGFGLGQGDPLADPRAGYAQFQGFYLFRDDIDRAPQPLHLFHRPVRVDDQDRTVDVIGDKILIQIIQQLEVFG